MRSLSLQGGLRFQLHLVPGVVIVQQYGDKKNELIGKLEMSLDMLYQVAQRLAAAISCVGCLCVAPTLDKLSA